MELKGIILSLVLAVSPFGAFATNMYLDPDWAGTESGTASEPFASLDASAWTIINTELASNPVTLYYSAFETNGTTQESQAWKLQTISRTDGSTNILTFNGHGFYNTNDSTPSWSANATAIGTAFDAGKVFKFANTGAGAAEIYEANYITITGFEFTSSTVSGTQPRVKIRGDLSATDPAEHIVFEYNYVSTGTGVGISVGSYAGYTQALNVTVSNNHITDGGEEGIYISAMADGITVSGNKVHDNGVGSYGGNGQGDGIEFKPWILSISARPGGTNIIENNEIYQPDADLDGDIIGMNVLANGVIVRNNHIYDIKDRGLVYGATEYTQGAYCVSEEITSGYIYNNIIVQATVNKAAIWIKGGNDSGCAGTTDPVNIDISGVIVANNTIDLQSTGQSGISFRPNDGTLINITVKNNIFMTADSTSGLMVGSPASQSGAAVFTATDYNNFYSTVGAGDAYINFDSTNRTLAQWQAAHGTYDQNSVNADPGLDAAYEYQTVSDNGVNDGVDLSGTLPTSTDKAGVARPQGASWDIGAYEFIIAGSGGAMAISGDMTVTGTLNFTGN